MFKIGDKVKLGKVPDNYCIWGMLKENLEKSITGEWTVIEVDNVLDLADIIGCEIEQDGYFFWVDEKILVLV